MNQRLSAKFNLVSKIILAFAIWLVLSLPIGLFDYFLIYSPIVFLVLLQRAIHFGICLAVVLHFSKDKVVLEYNETELIVNNKPEAQETRIPFSKIQKLSLEPALFSINQNKSFKFQLQFLDENGLEDSLYFKAYPGKKLNNFIKAVEDANPDFLFDNWTYQ